MADSPDVFTLIADPLPPSTRVLTFTGNEGISRLYTFEVLFVMAESDASGFDEEAALLQAATLSLNNADGSPRQQIHGIFASIEFVASHAADVIFRAVLVPKLWKLTLTRHSRVWVEGTRPDTIPNILDAVLKANGLAAADFDINVTRSSPAQLHVCQYKESDFDFISRWMEREGIYFYFEQTDAGEKLHIIDSKDSQSPLGGPVRYFPTGDTDTGEVDAMETFRARHAALPEGYKARDYDYLRPAIVEGGPEPIADNGFGQIVGWADNFDIKPSPERRIPANRAGEMAAKAKIFHGRGRLFDLRPGYFFDLEEHPRDALNTRYLTTELEHHGNQLAAFPGLNRVLNTEEGRTYKVFVTAIPGATQYRAPRRTAWPRIYGVESALVDGPLDDDYAQIDSHGRYKVKIHFDESSLRDGKASMWVRMLQPHSGEPEGWHLPLRKGTEVMLVFMGGDPDRPVITGAVPNPATPSPVTSSNHTQNVVQTGGRSRLEIEDLEGSQYIDISTPPQHTHIHLGATHDPHTHNWVVSTDGTGLLHTGGNHDVTVGGNMTEDVKGNLTETYHGTQTTTVTKHVAEEYKATFGTHVIGAVSQTYDNTLEVHVTGAVDIKYDATLTRTIGTGETHTVSGGGQTVTINGGQTLNITGFTQVTNTGSYQQTITNGGLIISPAGYTIIAPAGHTVVAAAGVTEIATAQKTEQHSSWFKWTWFSLEIVAISKITIGVSKVDIFATSLAVTGLKGDVYGSKAETLGAYFSALGAKIKTAATAISNGAVEMKNYVAFLVS